MLWLHIFKRWYYNSIFVATMLEFGVCFEVLNDWWFEWKVGEGEVQWQEEHWVVEV